MCDGTARILCVDDETNVRNALRRALRKEPYEILFAENGVEALEVMEREQVDILLSDHLMPEMTGLELIRKVATRWPSVLRMILTGHAELGMVIDAINRGDVYRFLTKPWDNVDLKITFRLAVSRLELERENRHLLEVVRQQARFISALEGTYQGITPSPTGSDEGGPIVVGAIEFAPVEQ